MNPHPFDEEDLSLSLPQRILRRLPARREQLVADLTGPAVPTTPEDVRAAVLTLVTARAIAASLHKEDPILLRGPRADLVADALRAANRAPSAPRLPEPPCPDCADPAACRSMSAACMQRHVDSARQPRTELPRVPARHLYSGAARSAYLALVRRDDAAANQGIRERAHLSPRSPATAPAFLAPLRDEQPLRFLLLGAGPDPRAEADVLRALISSVLPVFVVVHDVAAESEPREAYAADAARLLLDAVTLPRGSAAAPPKLRREVCGPWGVALSCVDLAAPEWAAPNGRALISDTGAELARPFYCLATLLGYTLANLTTEQRHALLCSIPAEWLLLDLPLAPDPSGRSRPRRHTDPTGDPRVDGVLTPMEAEWLRAAAADAGLSGPFCWAVTDESAGYRVDLAVQNRILLSWTRRTLAGWLHELEVAGWRTVRVDVSRDAAHPLPRAGILLRRPEGASDLPSGWRRAVPLKQG